MPDQDDNTGGSDGITLDDLAGLGFSAEEATPPDHRVGFVALAGCPNVGKSTLLNQFIGTDLAIATPMSQTTRHLIRGVLTRPEAQLVFVDTPGFHEPRDTLNEKMVDLAARAVADADVILMLVDASRKPGDGDRAVAARCKETGKPVMLLLNQWDKVQQHEWTARLRDYAKLGEFSESRPLVALDPAQAADLIPLLIDRLPEGPRLYPTDVAGDQTPRDLVAELVREQVIKVCSQEVPHQVAVIVDDYQDAPENAPRKGDRVRATIYVERESQKAILVGKGGTRIRDIGKAARGRLAQMLGHPVHLNLFVKVHPHWRRDGRFLNELGYPK